MEENKESCNVLLPQKRQFSVAELEADFRKAEKSWWCSQRWILAYVGLWLGMIKNIVSCDMSMAIVCMVKDTAEESGENNISYGSNATRYNADYNDDFNVSNIQNETYKICGPSIAMINIMSEQAEFIWNRKSQSLVLSAFFYGYVLIQIPGGWLATRFGGRQLIGISVILSSALMLLMPLFARASVYLVVVARALLGFCIGSCSPTFCGMVGRWALPTERNRFMSMYWFGQMAGTVLGYSTSGILCVHGFDNGWASIFYVHGMLCVLLACCWWLLVYTYPEEHPRISLVEKRLLLSYHGLQSKQRDIVPWKSVLTYLPVYAIFVAQTADGWTYFLILTCLPLYLKEVHRFDIQSNGFLSCLPFIAFMIGSAGSGVFADFVRTRNCFTVTRIRKLFQIAGFIGVAAFILIPGYLDCEKRHFVIVCLCLATFFEAVGMVAGYSSNTVDIAPRFASLIFGMSNTLANVSGIIAPLAVAALTKHQTVQEWRLVFYISVGVSLFASIFYGLFANSELASWASREQEVKVPKEIMESEQTEIPVIACTPVNSAAPTMTFTT